MTRTKAMLLDTAAVGSFFTRLAFFVLVVLPIILWNAPAFATTLEERTAEDQAWVNAMKWVDICTTGQGWKFSEAERLKICVILEQQLRDKGRCMYSPGVIGTWDGEHCR